MKTVLIVEDDYDIQEPLRELLADEGYTVLCASSGKEALELLGSLAEFPGIVLCDLMMPDMDGVQFVTALKEQKNCLDERTVILSAADQGQQMADSLGVGFLKKPIDIDCLLKTVHDYCS